ncbi:MAG: low molecular weight phosphotyrosine protein phosphatase [Oscillospiraceae bacterium]|nr:low molecular weight phosphotyrosine protein phosphatase [Oscillospiraceae bacterium]
MNSILFLCHGNICRSPMAEFIMKDLLSRRGMEGDMTIDSAAVSREEIGNDMYPPAKRILAKHGIPFSSRAARQIEEEDLKRYSIIIAMDRSNLRMLKRLFGERSTADVRLLMSYAGADRDVEDPWYTGDFEQAYTDIVSGCTGLFREIYE